MSIELHILNMLENCINKLHESIFKKRINSIYSSLIVDETLPKYFKLMKQVEVIKDYFCLKKIQFGEFLTKECNDRKGYLFL